MDITKTNTAIDGAIGELNNLTDAAFKARNVAGIRSLTLAAQNLEAAQTHLAKAQTQSQPKAAKETPAVAAKVGSSKK